MGVFGDSWFLILVLYAIIYSSAAAAAAKTRHLKWAVEYMHWAPDGLEGMVITINGQFPGPTIRARAGDTIHLQLTNKLHTEGVVIHWHGIRQRKSPHPLSIGAFIESFQSGVSLRGEISIIELKTLVPFGIAKYWSVSWTMASPQIQPTSWWPSTTLPPPRSTTTTVAASASIQPPANMDAIIAIFQRLERRLDEQLAAASWPPRPNPDPPYGMSSSSWDLPPARPVSSWDLPQSRLSYDQHAQRFPSSSSPDPDAYDPNLCSHPSYWNYSDPYAYDPPVGRPLTSWDLPRPRIESYGGGGSSPYMYGASRTHGDGGYAPSSYHGGGYSRGGYANESNSYAPPPPPPQVSCYVPAPQPNPPSRPQPQQPDGGYVLVPPSYTPPPHPWDSPCSLTTLNDVRFTTSIEREKERGVREMVEEEKKDTEVTENPIIEAETMSKTIVHRVEKDKRSQLSTDSEISVPRASFLASSKAFVAVANPGRCFSTAVKVSAAAQNELDKALDIKALVREPESRPNPNAHEKADSSSGDKNYGPDFGKIVDATGSGQQHRSGYWKTGSVTKLLSLDAKKPLKESPIWIDSSITEQCNDSEKALGDAMELSSLKGSRTDEKFTGLPIMRIVGTPQEAYKDMERISLVSSYMASLLIGSYAATDHTD